LNNKLDILKESSTMLLASVLMVGFIGISSPFSIFAQEYHDDDYESEYSQYYNDDYETKYYDYESYMKDDNSKPSIQKISCNNIIKNSPVDNNVDTSSAFDLPGGDSQLGQDRMNADQKGDFVYVCQNNNNIVNINNNDFDINNETTVNNLSACNNVVALISSNNSGSGAGAQSFTGDTDLCNNSTLTFPFNPSQSSQDSDSGVITSSSISNGEQAQSQHIKLLQDGNGVEINQQGNQPLDIRQIKSSQNDNGIEIQQQGSLPTGITQQLEDLSIKDSPIISQGLGDSPKLTTLEKQQSDHSPELTATEKTTKLKQQWLELLP
jgi:hypothetical protein